MQYISVRDEGDQEDEVQQGERIMVKTASIDTENSSGNMITNPIALQLENHNAIKEYCGDIEMQMINDRHSVGSHNNEHHHDDAVSERGSPSTVPLLSTPNTSIHNESLQSPSRGSSKSVKNNDYEDFHWTTSVWIVAALTFVGDLSRGVLFPVLFPLCQALGGSTIDLGFIVAMFSIGRLVVTTPLGYFCDRYRHRLSLLLSTIILFIGAILWSVVYLTHSLPVLYIAQLILGLGSGSLGVTRSYVVEQCPPKRRTESLAIMTALQYAGFTTSPFLGSLLAMLGRSSSTGLEYALPALFMALLALGCIFALIVAFQDLPTVPKTKSTTATTSTASTAVNEDNTATNRLILAMILLNFTTKGSIAVYETLASQIGLTDYHMSRFNLGLLVTTAGVIGFVQLLRFDLYTKRFHDLHLMIGGIVIMMIAQFTIYNFGRLIPSYPQYIVCLLLMYAIGYPIGHTALLGAFAKIQKAGPQASLMSWFATSGSFGRIVLPIISGLMDSRADNSPFMLVLILLSLSLIAIVVLKHAIVYYTSSDSHKLVHPREQKLEVRDKICIAIAIVIMIFGIIAAIFTNHEAEERGNIFDFDFDFFE